MAKVLVITTTDALDSQPWASEDFRRLQEAADFDSFRVHTRVDDPEQADLILFVGAARPDYADVRSHPYVHKFRDKCFLFEAGDSVIAFLPGIYASAERPWHSWRARGGFYLRVFENDAIGQMPATTSRMWLFSFVGTARNAHVRKRISNLRHARGLIIDTSDETLPQTDASTGPNAARWRRYLESLNDSQFVLCPRGLGTSSWRLFEAMKAGRAPVILSDRWIRPKGPDWDTFSIRIAESDVTSMADRLADREGDAAAMGVLARAAWDEWFSRDVAFHRIVEWCLAIRDARVVPEGIARLSAYGELLRPRNVRRHLLSPLKQRILARIR